MMKEGLSVFDLAKDEKKVWERREPRRTSPISFFGMGVLRTFLAIMLVMSHPTLVRGNLETGCVNSFDPLKDYFPEKITVAHSEDFTITYNNHFKLVANERTGESFALYQCGTPAPEGLSNSTKIFPIPFSSVGITTTIEISFLEKLGLRSMIKFVSGASYITSPCLQAQVLSGDTKEFDSDPTSQEAQVDGVFVYSVNASNPKQISVSTSFDPGALHRAEWISFISLFFNKEKEANRLFDETKRNFECTSELAKESSSPKVVAWVDYYSWQTNKYVIVVAEYKMDFIEALGATPLNPEVSQFATVQEWQQAMANVDIVIDETYLGDMNTFYSNFNLSATSNFKFIQNGQVWKFDKLQSDLGSLDWFESAVASPDAVLQDLYSIIYPEEFDLDHTRVWFRNSFKNEAVVVEGSSGCPNPSSTLPVERAAVCTEPSPSSSSSYLVPSLLFPLLAFFLSLLFLSL